MEATRGSHVAVLSGRGGGGSEQARRDRQEQVPSGGIPGRRCWRQGISGAAERDEGEGGVADRVQLGLLHRRPLSRRREHRGPRGGGGDADVQAPVPGLAALGSGGRGEGGRPSARQASEEDRLLRGSRHVTDAG